MVIRFEELSAPKRAGGIEEVSRLLDKHLTACGIRVSRSSHEAAGVDETLPDCVHFQGLWSPVLAKRFKAWQQCNIPCVVSPHGMLEPWALAHKGFKKKLAWMLYQKRILNQASALHATSLREAENLKALGLISPISKIPWGIEMPVESRQSSNLIEPEIRTALFVGRIFSVKGLPLLIDAWAKVFPSGWKMKIVGPDEDGHRVELERLVRQNNLEAEFEFTGPLDGNEKDEAYASAELFILPSHTENFGLVVGEALAHGLPVITTKGAPWEEVIENRCGWWTDISVDGIANALSEAISLSDQQRFEMGQRGRRLIESKYTWPRIAAEMKSVYEWVLDKGPKPNCVITD